MEIEQHDRNIHRVIRDLGEEGPIKLLLISDVHYDSLKCDRELLEKHLKQAKEDDAQIIINGDWFDVMGCKKDPRSQTNQIRHEYLHHDKTYLDSVVEDSFEFLKPYTENLLLIGEGNHECLDDQTEVLTEDGWKLIEDIEDEKVATMNSETEATEWQKPTKVHSYDYDGEMYHVSNRTVDYKITPNHRIIHQRQRHDDWSFQKAEDFSWSDGSMIKIPNATTNPNPEYDITDDEIRLLGWCLTDGTVSERDGVALYQSGEYVKDIKDLLGRLDCEYREYSRQRDIKEIDGKKLKSKPKRSYTFTIKGEWEEWIMGQTDSKREIPDLVGKLSKRQFDIFLDTVVKADGSVHTTSEDSRMVYKDKPFLGKLQGLCVTNGYRASLSTYRDKHYRLNICPKPTYQMNRAGEQMEKVDYKGKVYCLTVPNQNFFIRRKGKVCVTGNSNIRKRKETDPLGTLIYLLNQSTDHHVYKGGYSGVIAFKFARYGGRHHTKVLQYHHGHGGNAHRTKGMLDVDLDAAKWPDADIVIKGHDHNKWHTSKVRKSFNTQSMKRHETTQHHIRLGSYKKLGDGVGGWSTEKGHEPKKRGGWWCTFDYYGHDVTTEIVEAS